MLWRALIVVALLVGAATPRVAHAHFLWIVTESKDEKSAGKVKVYFGESAEPDDPSLLDRVAKAQAWAIKDGRKPEPVALTLTKGTDAHDYKFAASAVEDVSHASPNVRPQLLAASVYYLKGTADQDSSLLLRAREALASF